MKVFKRVLKGILALALTAAVCSGLAVASEGWQLYREAVEAVSLADKVASIQEKDGYTEYEELPQVYVDAVVSVEDKRFFRHGGVDPIAICRALIHDIQAGAFVEGGSTMTQQLAKNLYFSQEKELTRKAAEVFLAMDLDII